MKRSTETLFQNDKNMSKNAASNIEKVQEAYTPQSTSGTATYHPSRKLSKLDEPDMQDTAGKVGTSSSVMYYYGPLHIA